MEFLVIGLIVLVIAASPFVLLILHLIARDRLKKLERSLREIGDRYEERIGVLEARLAALDGGRLPTEANAPPRAPEARPDRAREPYEAPIAAVALREGGVTAQFPSEGPGQVQPRAQEPAAVESTPVSEGLEPQPAVVASEPSEAIPPALAATARPARSSAEWEEIIGGSWLNKAGAVVTVIGIALALGYSMRYLGPAGRIALALAASGTMLALGALLEERERYRVFSRGLIGAGWAGLYFTTFAMHGLDTARIIESPVVGTSLLLAVAAGMVLHSLVYRSQTVTGLAYFVTFATLAIAPATRFALFASVPAAASLQYIARRFRWPHMMVAGVAFTYGAYLLGGVSPDVGPQDWAFGQALLFVYWFLFETVDLRSLRARAAGHPGETIMPLNAAGFVGASLLGWSTARPESLWLFFVIAAGLFAASAALRAQLSAGSTAAATAAGAKVRPDGPEVSLTVAAAMLALGIENGFDGWRQTVAWMLEAQLLILSGLRLRNAFVRHLGSAVLAVPVSAVIAGDLPSSATFVAAGHRWLRSTPVALLTAAVLYLDRALLRRGEGVRAGGLELLYNGVGTFLVAAVLANELPGHWIAPAWFALGLCLAGFGLARAARELFLQGSVLVTFAWLLTLFGNVPTRQLVWGVPARWATALPMVAVMYLLAYRRRSVSGEGAATYVFLEKEDSDAGALEGRSPRARFDALAAGLERRSVAAMFGAATFLLSWFLLFEVSGRWLTVAWGLQGVALLAVGFVAGMRPVRFTGLALLGVCICKLLVYDVAELEMIFRIFSFIILGALLLAVSFAYGRYREEIRRLL